MRTATPPSPVGAIAAHADAHFPILCRLIGRPDMAEDARYGNVQDRRTHQSGIIEVVSADTFVRPIYAGNAIQKVEAKDFKKIITARVSAFVPPPVELVR